MSRGKSARRRNRVGARPLTVPGDHALLRRRVPDHLNLTMLIGAWKMSDGDDFAVLWHVTRTVTGALEEQRKSPDEQPASPDDEQPASPDDEQPASPDDEQR